MSKRILSLICVGLLSTMLVGCGDDDPSKNNSTINNGNNGNNGSNNNSNNGNNGSNNNSNNNNNNNNNSNNSNNSNNGSTNNSNNGGTECARLDNFYGQIGGSGAHDGGAPDVDGVLTNDAGLAAVLAAMPTTPSTTEAPDAGKATVDLDVTGALVTSTFFDDAANNVFWLEDSTTRMRVRLGQGENQPTTIKVGSTVSFKVTEVTNFDSTPQISKIEGVVEDSAGEGVPYIELNGTEPTIDQFNQIVRLWGTVTTDNGGCGGSSICYNVEHGGDATKTTILRTTSNFIEVGDCITFAGPLSAFPGPLSSSATHTIQIDQSNFNWLFEQN